ncbi:SDR family oxidoreductase [Clostridium manihotivorum]|uniref:dTDP-4-dehydrorhamnose reductase n=1 Tax=Clostridium manihotivorum TaxID=2320868 RepID=A0A410DX66_9CLOT|nr:sugar nucleotide-binding protein [Clostridium manihotivorum]QAA33532.1 NAD(P)-dependent oxidoreductase [Clostridium manihotivorum]
MDTIVITGAEGFFASRFVQYYRDKYNIIALNHRDLDICDQEKTIEKIIDISPKYLIHSAAISDTGKCENDPELSYAVNVNGTINITKGCAAAGAKLIYLSSDQIYNGNVEAGPYKEDCVVLPNTVYGRHKLEAENALCGIADDPVILRLTWLFSLPERNVKINSNIIWNLVKATLKGEKMTLPANEYRGITYVYDLISNFHKLLNLPKGIYNTGSENNLSTYEVGKVILENMGLGHRVEELLIKDTERYKENNRDLRICNKKLRDQKICFTDTEEAVSRCIGDFIL